MRALILCLCLGLPAYVGNHLLTDQELKAALIFWASINLLSFLVMAIDKRRAKRNLWRIPESTLHFFELIAGWFGSGMGQIVFHHKTRKTSYQIAFWLIVALYQIAAIYWLVTR